MSLVYIIIGVSGSGKTTIGEKLAETLDLPFFDADSFHSSANVKKMSSGIPLDDSDRLPWLQELSKNIAAWNKSEGAVLACSALKEEYRRLLAVNNQVRWIVLEGSKALISARMATRADHYMKPGMLESQFATWESPSYGIKINIDHTPEQMLDQIKLELRLSEFGVVGLGTMGANIARNLLRNSISTAVYNRNAEGEAHLLPEFLEEQNCQILQGTDSLEEFISILQRPRKILIMIPSGAPTDILLNDLVSLLDEGDIVLDGGNVHYENSKKRNETLTSNKIHYLATGISGGSYGALHGPSIMVGGKPSDYSEVRTILECIAAKDSNGIPCAALVGPESSGHFVKMLHNGIEYVEMQLLAECYSLLRPGHTNNEISAIWTEWNSGDLNSFLLEISADILKVKDGDNFLIDLIRDEASSKGTGSWTVSAGLELGVSTSMTHAAVEARYISMMKSERIGNAMQNAGTESAIDLKIDDLIRAYTLARIINHHQGFEMLKGASKAHEWQLDLSEIARIWTSGCILQSGLMKEISSKLKVNGSILKNPSFENRLKLGLPSLIKLINESNNAGIAMPCFSSALQYYSSISTKDSTANLIQAQRDYFGSHSFKRTDDTGDASHSINWRKDG